MRTRREIIFTARLGPSVDYKQRIFWNLYCSLCAGPENSYKNPPASVGGIWNRCSLPYTKKDGSHCGDGCGVVPIIAACCFENLRKHYLPALCWRLRASKAAAAAASPWGKRKCAAQLWRFSLSDSSNAPYARLPFIKSKKITTLVTLRAVAAQWKSVSAFNYIQRQKRAASFARRWKIW